MFAGRGRKDSATKEAAPAPVEEDLPKIDVSIPYNAAAMLAFDEWKGEKELSKDAFAKFEAVYEEKAVAMATAKKVKRELEEVVRGLEDTIKKADAKLAKLGEE